ncbi:MAG: hypothetical protein Q8R79_00350, partial [Legionellaceae bacterium]|nr:hypothetical protein [Legionellaceae bacterium]
MPVSARGTTLAQAVYLGFLSVGTVSDKLKLSPKERATLEAIYGEVLISPKSEGIAMLAEACEKYLNNFEKKSLSHKEDIIAQLSQNSNKQDIQSSADNSDLSSEDKIGLFKIAPEAVFMAASLVAAIRGMNTGSAAERGQSLAKKSEGLVLSTYGIYQNTFADQTENIASGALGLEVGVIVGLLREYNYNSERKKQKSEQSSISQEAQKVTLNAHLMYKNLAEFYEKEQAEVKEKYPDAPEKAEAVLKEWLSVRDTFQHNLDEMVQQVVNIGANTQEGESKMRVQRITGVANTLASGLVMAGPPGHVASLLIKGATSLAQNVSDSYVTNSAKDNWGVMAHNPYVLITNPDDIVAAQEKVRGLESPTIAITGPVFEGPKRVAGKRLPGQSNDSVAKREVQDKALNRTCCSFALTSSLPARPEPLDLGENPSFKDKKVKDACKDRITFIKNTLHHIEKEQAWLTSLATNMVSGSLGIHDEKQSWPYVINAEDLRKSLIEYAHDLEQEAQSLQQVMEDNAYTGDAREWMQTAQKSLANITTQDQSLHNFNEVLGESVHAQFLYQDGKIRVWDTMSAGDQNRLSIEYARHPQAARALQSQCEYTLDSLEKLTAACEALHKGRHIQNAPQALHELETQSKLLLGVFAEQIKVNPSLAHTLNRFSEKVQKLESRFLALDLARVEHISHLLENNTLSALDAYRALSEMENKMHQYSQSIATENTVYKKTLNKIHQQSAELLKHPKLYSELHNPTAIRLDALQPGDRIIFPDRGLFGLSKHADMAKQVALTVQGFQKHCPDMKKFQILPLPAIDDQWIAQCRGDQKKLGSAIEGLKTEIQWVQAFNQYT